MSTKAKWGLGILTAIGVGAYAFRGKIADKLHWNRLEKSNFPSGLTRYDYYVWASTIDDAKIKTLAQFPGASIQETAKVQTSNGVNQYRVTFARM